ncbi:MAG: hypothetical protein ACK5U8_26370, partial [Deltaproteobacteria bacterium]
ASVEGASEVEELLLAGDFGGMESRGASSDSLGGLGSIGHGSPGGLGSVGRARGGGTWALDGDTAGAPIDAVAEAPAATAAPARAARSAPPAAPPRRESSGGRWMRRVWVRVGEVSGSGEVTFREQEAARVAEQQLQFLPDSRDRHRAAVRALARAGNVERALEVAEAWIARDRMDPEALGARADLLARSGHRDEALRVLTGIVDLRPDDALLQERLANAFERAGQGERGCAHRVAMAELDTNNGERVGAAVRCERALGQSAMADLLLRSVREERARERARRVAAGSAAPLPTRGELLLDASWAGGDDLDLALITPDGSRLSWMGGRTGVVASAPTGAGTETLGLRSATAGSYLIEVSRTSAPDRGVFDASPITGTIRVRVLDATQTIRFTLDGERALVGRAVVRREQRTESVPGGW